MDKETMTAGLEGKYSIEKKENIVIVSVQDIFGEGVVSRYREDMINLTLEMKHQAWASLIVYHGGGLFSPEDEAQIIDITKFRMQHNMVANATVFFDNAHADIQQMQLRRIYGSCRLPFYVFSETGSAKSWLQDFLSKQHRVS